MRKYLLAFGALCLAVTARAERPVEDFGTLPAIENPVLSPNGNRIAMRVNQNGKQILVIWPLETGKQPTVINSGANDLNWWRWVNDDWLVAGIGANYKLVGTEDWYIRRAMAISADGKTMKILAENIAMQNADDVLWTARDGSAQLLLAYQTSVFREDKGLWPQVDLFDLATGKQKKVVDSTTRVRSWYSDEAGNVRFGIGTMEGSRMLQLLYRKSNGELFRTVEKAFLGKGESLLVPHIFSADGKTAITVADKDGFDAAYAMNLETFELGEKLHSVAGYDVEGLVADSSGTGLAGVTYTDQRDKALWLDPIIADVQNALEQSVPGKAVSILSMDRNRVNFLVRIGNASSAGIYYLFDKRVGKLQRLSYGSDRLKGTELAPVKSIRYKARDGLEIEAVLTLPKGRKADKLPLILMPHGGPFARDSEAWDWWSQFLADRGYAVLQPNYRGSSGYGVAFADKGEGQWGLAMQDDLDDAVSWAVQQGIADAMRVCIVGGSYGGYAAMRAAQRGGKRYRCAASFAGVSDLEAMRRYDGSFLNGKFASDWLDKQVADLDAVSPLRQADKVAIPMLLVHGKKDLRVPYKQSASFADKLKKAGGNVHYVEQPEGDHYLSREADRIQLLTELETFLDKHNPADPAPASEQAPAK